MANDAEAGLQKLQGALSSGHLRLEPDVAERCAKQCDELARGAREQARKVVRRPSVGGFGAFESGGQLQNGFNKKTDLAAQHLAEYASVADRMAETFRRAGAKIAHVDQQNRTDISSTSAGTNGTQRP